MVWSVEEVEGIKVIAIREAVEGEALAALVELVEGLLTQPPLRLIFNLAHCPSVSSEALRFFLQVGRRVESQGGAFALAAPNEEVGRSLQLSGVSRLIKVAASTSEMAHEASASEPIAQLARRVVELLARAEARTGA